MNICPITYEDCGEDLYSIQGLKLLSPKLKTLNVFDYSALEQLQQAAQMADKISIQGVQPKLSAILNISQSRFELVDIFGTYILKPQQLQYPELPENESISMKMAALSTIEIPVCGLIYSKDKSFSYFCKRFDRINKNEKLLTEDFAQLAMITRELKYDYTMEKLVKIIDQFCTFSLIEKRKLFKRVIFNFIIGNEDMHLKNYSLITRNRKIELSPAYDLVNTSIVIQTDEEIALKLAGKKKHLKRSDFIDYFGYQHLNLPKQILNDDLDFFYSLFPIYENLISISFLSHKLKEKYLDIISKRKNILFA